jgi:hypothetical protein
VSRADLDRRSGLIQINTTHRKIADGDQPFTALEVAMTTVAGQAFILYAELFVISFADR